MTDSIRTRIADKLTGKSTYKYYKFYSKTQWYSRDEIAELQLEKLKLLLIHCYQNVPYYRKIINESSIDLTQIKSFDVLENFPVITKQTIIENYNDFIPKNLIEIGGVKHGQTGGTTGQILKKRTDFISRSSAWGAYRRFIDWMDIKESDPKLKLLGGHIRKAGLLETIKSSINDTLTNDYAFDPYDNSDENVNKIREVLKNKNIRLIRSYSQYLYGLARHFDDNNETFDVKAIMTTAEPLMPEHRLLFKKVFNAESFDQYGSGEIGAIAFECNKHEGLHITEERVIVEQDTENNLIFTDLDNYALPYIRYKNNDQAIISPQTCSCGRQHRLIKEVLGRTCDYITGSNGKNLHWAFFWHLMFDTEIAHKRGIKKFQVKQCNEKEIYFRYVGDEMTNEDMNLLGTLITEKLGLMAIVYKNEIDIENSVSGKYRPVVNEILLRQ